ncbi:MAG: hypothetical protein U9Q69_01225 [Nanoarchaeota archaeon]|nr:hypothetical protein [Nanoarchaeota archaeon]
MINEIQTFNEELLKEYNKKIQATWMIKGKEEFCILLNDLDETINLKEIEAVAESLQIKCKIKRNIKFYMVTDFFSKISNNDFATLKEIKDSMGIYDPSGFISSLRNLIEGGQILGLNNSVKEVLGDAKNKFKIIEGYKREVLYNCYQAVIDSAHAALLARGYSIPIIENIPKNLTKKFVKEKLLEKGYVAIFEDVMKMFNDYEFGKIKIISIKGLEEIFNDAMAFVERMKAFVYQIL